MMIDEEMMIDEQVVRAVIFFLLRLQPGTGGKKEIYIKAWYV